MKTIVKGVSMPIFSQVAMCAVAAPVTLNDFVMLLSRNHRCAIVSYLVSRQRYPIAFHLLPVDKICKGFIHWRASQNHIEIVAVTKNWCWNNSF